MVSLKKVGFDSPRQFSWNIGAVILFLLTFDLKTRAQSNNIKAKTCLQQTCVKVASKILSAMDQTVSPCDNFYEFACKGWIEKARIPHGFATTAVLHPFYHEAFYFVKDLLESKPVKGENQDIQLDRTYYKSCVNKSRKDNRDIDPILRQLINQFDGWILLPSGSAGARSDKGVFLQKNNFNLAKLYLPLLEHFHYTPLFNMQLGFDQMNISRMTLELAGLVLDEYVETWILEGDLVQRGYKHFMGNYSAALGVSDELLAELDAVFEFEKTIAQHMGDIGLEENYEKLSIKNLTQRCPVMDWLWLFNKLYAPINHTISEDDEITLNNYVDFGERCNLYLDYLANETGIRILHNAAVWQFLWKTIDTLPNSAWARIMDGRCVSLTEQEVRLNCARETYNMFTYTIDRYIIKEKLDNKNRGYVNDMAREVKEALMENLATTTWLEKEDTPKVLKKLSKLNVSVGSSKMLDNGTISGDTYRLTRNLSEETYLENFLEASRIRLSVELLKTIGALSDIFNIAEIEPNAYYDPYSNNAYVAIGHIPKPFQDADFPVAVNYGFSGFTIGHELTHAFDKLCVRYDHNGIRPMLTNKSQETFARKAQCLVDQYNGYSILDLNINGNKTLGENIADNGGLKAAFKAFKKRQAAQGFSLDLPGVNFTSDQLFFIAFAQGWCIKARPSIMERWISGYEHTPNEYRIIGVLSNSEEFARTFNCPVGSRMNPKEKCSVW